MNYQILAGELALPAYTGLSDQAAADALNAQNIAVDVETISGSDVFEATTQSDYAALTATQKSLYHAIMGINSITVRGSNTRAALLAMFGAGSQTRANLGALQSTLTSRREQLGLPQVGAHHVTFARANGG